MFASGGYDHLVHLWNVTPDLSAAHPRALSIKHNSVVQALLSIRDSSHKLISGGADCSFNIFDLASERVVNSIKTSNIVYNLHSLASSPFTTLVEVAHRDLQFEVRDHRVVPESPVHRFGYSCQQVAGRFIRGASLLEGSSLFACGDREGMVRVWDMRDTRQTVNEMVCMEGQKIVQVLFHDSTRILACSSNHVMLRSL
ncbi:hypothetical protein BDZ89DRAFT_965042 [Hymenopellis radicata]|nr:hypothetical protein BDZ89DRAFT_965042 [Hymenopellis radicata]